MHVVRSLKSPDVQTAARFGRPLLQALCVVKTISSIIVFLAGLTLLAGCRANYSDVSSDAKYADLVGQEIRLIQDFRIHAVTLSGSPSDQIDAYSITPMPGFGGRHVPFRKSLRSGTVLRILKVMHCSNCLDWGFGKIHFVVEPPSEKYSDHEVSLRAFFGAEHLLKNHDGRAVFDSPLIEVVSEA